MEFPNPSDRRAFMDTFDYTVETPKSVEEAVEAVVAASKENGFGVLHIHDVQATLAAKGFFREPMKIIEICNAKFASEVLEKDIKISLMLPCPISVYTESGKTYVCTLRPRIMGGFYPEAGIEAIAGEVDRIVVKIVDAAK
jgi:uncharacterized protein (DUF302 family)